MMEYRLASAAPDEEVVFGACRPGYPSRTPDASAVSDWITTMRDVGIERVCCLLADRQLEYYDGLLDRYQEAFGADRVTHAPVRDHTAVEAPLFRRRIHPALRTADRLNQRIVVHCSAGIGRTGQVLALWLALEREYALADAVTTVHGRGRDPLEAISHAELREEYHTIRDNEN